MNKFSDFRIKRTIGKALMPKAWDAYLTVQTDDASVNQ
jgi:hypothetical protein